MLKRIVEEIRLAVEGARLPTRKEIEQDIAADPHVRDPDKSFPHPDYVKLRTGHYQPPKEKKTVGIKLIRKAMHTPTFGAGPQKTKATHADDPTRLTKK